MTLKTNLSDVQINGIESILSPERVQNDMYSMPLWLDHRTLHSFLRSGIITYMHTNGKYTLSSYGIQSYCATILLKYNGPTHERIHTYLTEYQRLFNS